ncbi:MAG: ABC transporter substrate-binding protein [Chloroflexi bacterium]|nr:ABC transporter substrate-binding protein [Chloroflexota bacterium]
MSRQLLKRMTLFVSLVAAFVMVIAACGSSENTPTPKPTTAPQPSATAAPQASATTAPATATRPAATATNAPPSATPAPTPTPAPTATQAAQVKTGGVLRARDIVAWQNWDSWSLFGGFALLITENMHSNLMHPKVDDPTVMLPDLATSWSASSDGLTYTLKIRPGVKWTDGKDFTAADVVWNFQRGMTPPDPLTTHNLRRVAVINTITAPDAATVVITLKRASASFAANLGGASMLMYAPQGPAPASMENVVGTGPFKFSKFDKAAGQLDLVRNPGYYQKDEAGRALPYTDGLSIFTIGDATAAKAALTSGKLDCGCEYDHDYVTAAIADLKKQGIRTYTSLADQFFLEFNTTKAPFDKLEVRRAFSELLDRRSLAPIPRSQGDAARFPPNFMKPSNLGGQWGLPESELLQMPGFRDYAADKADALNLLKTAGIDLASLNIQFLGILNPNVDPYHTAAENLLVNAGAKSLTYVQKASGTLQTDLAAKGWNITMTNGGTGIDDPDDNFMNFFTGNGPANYAKLDFGIDALATQEDSTLDPAKRRDIIWTIMRKLINDATAIPAVYQVDGFATQANIEGYVPPFLSTGPQFRLERLWINK